MSDTFDAPGSRNEAILQNMLGANNPLEPPGSRIEDLLQQLLEEGRGSGLPDVTATDNGKVLGVENGAWGKVDAIPVATLSNDFTTATFASTVDAENAVKNKQFLAIRSAGVYICYISILGTFGDYKQILVSCTDRIMVGYVLISGTTATFYSDTTASAVSVFTFSHITTLAHKDSNPDMRDKFYGYSPDGLIGFQNLPVDPNVAVYNFTEVAGQIVTAIMQTAISAGSEIAWYMPLDATMQAITADLFSQLRDISEKTVLYGRVGNYICPLAYHVNADASEPNYKQIEMRFTIPSQTTLCDVHICLTMTNAFFVCRPITTTLIPLS